MIRKKCLESKLKVNNYVFIVLIKMIFRSINFKLIKLRFGNYNPVENFHEHI